LLPSGLRSTLVNTTIAVLRTALILHQVHGVGTFAVSPPQTAHKDRALVTGKV
jgi:hypothetical protein